MAVDAKEPNRNYPIPDEANNVSDEFPRLKVAITMIGEDMAAAFLALANKAAATHTHLISQISGLQAALDAKQNAGGTVTLALDDLSDVTTTGAATYQVLARIGGQWQPWTIDLTYANGFSQRLAASTIDAGQITTGTLDPARIPVLQSQLTIVSTGAIAALTSAQQGQIVAGTHVTTTDGRRWVYSGTGSKIAEASYIELADVTPDWSVIVNKPTISSFALTVLDDTSAAAMKATLLMGSAADYNIASSAAIWQSQPAVVRADIARDAAAEVTFTYAGSVTLDGNTGINFVCTLGAAGITLNNPVNMPNGRSGYIRLYYGAAYTLALGAGWYTEDGLAPACSGHTLITYISLGSGTIFCSILTGLA